MRFEATDGVELAALLFEPKRATTRAAIFLHGTGGSSVFESKRTNVLARELLDAGIAYFPFNNRGALVIRRLRNAKKKKSLAGGAAHERIRECVFDIDGAIRELRRRGYRDITLIGHSTGANKIAVYDHYKPRNPIKRYVLLGGGDDTGMLYAPLGPRRFANALEKARAMIRARRGEEFVPRALSPMLLSWQSFHDMANPDGDYNVFPFLEAMQNVRLGHKPRFRYLRGIRKPALVLYGEHDEYAYGDVVRCVAILADITSAQPNVELGIIADADHGFGGKEAELADAIVNWWTASL
ncbi:MAG: alpha/beta fold hydrolase [Acidobacteria bacterium]|nr:alpha/beta fold hydrolase [Acidobacteriota bacterium]